jgi:hypothetical protein
MRVGEKLDHLSWCRAVQCSAVQGSAVPRAGARKGAVCPRTFPGRLRSGKCFMRRNTGLEATIVYNGILFRLSV